MCLIKTCPDKGPIEAIGAFAGADIPQGPLAWPSIAGVDTSADRDQSAGRAPIVQKRLARRARCADGKLILRGDHGQYTNRPGSPNAGAIDGSDAGYALRDVETGEAFTFKLPVLEAVQRLTARHGRRPRRRDDAHG